MGSEGHPTTTDVAGVVTKLLEAISNYDAKTIRALCSPDLRRWLSLTEQETSLDELVGTVEREASVVDHATFTLRRRMDTADGGVLMLTVDGATKGGSNYHIPVCLAVTVGGGLVTRIDEYANIERAQDLLKEMFAT